MSTRFEDVVELEKKLFFPAVRRWPVALERGQGSRVWDVDGKEYIDLTAGWGVTSLGHSHPALAVAIAEQARTLMQTTNAMYSLPQLELARRLDAITPEHLHRSFFVSSGAEANEGALKLAHAKTGRSRFVATFGSFHGRTLGAMGCIGQDKYRGRWKAIVREATFVPYGDLEAAQRALGPEIAAMIVEPIQGEGGVVTPPEGYLRGLEEACHAVGALLILDEIQTGIGRTGRWLALEHSGVRPDVLTLAKGLGGGVPIGAVMASDDVLAAVVPGDHGGTYAGNLLACRAAETVLRVIEEEKLIERAAQLGDRLGARLRALGQSAAARIATVRGVGLFWGLELREAEHASRVHAQLRERGVLINLTADKVLRFFPPLTIPEEDLERALGVIEEVV
jgi:predicted acetylornithine/succinylornithine family transaminase